jgi:hypothetical protein
MIKIMKNLICIAFIGLLTNCALAQTNNQQEWRVTVKVADEDGNPIANAHVGVGFFSSGPQGIDGLTDTNGIFIATHSDSPGLMAYLLSFRVEKSGYYSTWSQTDLGPGYNSAKWNNVTQNLTLKKIVDPIPMYARWVSSEPNIFKKTGRPPIAFTNTAGYDLLIGDWVNPYGKGIHSDIIFTEEFSKKSFNDIYYKLTVSFPNKGDGIQSYSATDTDRASAAAGGLLSPSTAPADGYQPTFVETQNGDPNQIFFFRVQTILDENGNVKSALYGKIYGGFMQFRYYLNPTPNDRNVEFDPKQNLLGGLQSFEQVRDP